MNKESKIVVFGSSGMLGSSIVRKLKSEDYTNIITCNHNDLDLKKQGHTNYYFAQHKPEYVFMAAAKVGGLQANNTYRGEFIYDNLIMCANVIHAAYENKVKKLLLLGSNCLYPENVVQPIKEEYLLDGKLHPMNEPYAIAKIACIKMCEAYRSQYGCNFINALPCNLYGIGDHYDLEKCHVLPALIRKFHEGKINNKSEVVVWGSGGVAKREFLYVEDCADAVVFLMKNYDGEQPINVGSGSDISIKNLSQKVAEVIGFKGEIIFDETKPTGTEKKLLDITKLSNLGWFRKTGLTEGIQKTYNDIIKNKIYEQWS